MLSLLAACPGDGGEEEPPPPPTPEEVAAACEASFAARQTADEATCACEVEAGAYPDPAACLAAIGAPYASSCYCDLVAPEPANAAAVVCAAEAAEALAGCVQPLTCADAPARQACRVEHLQASGRCDPLVTESLAAVQIQCLGEPASVCGSGESIPAGWVCDGQPDCEDMSDESDCEFTCGSGEVVPSGFQCDAEPDCADGSDEEGCEFACESGEAVPLPARCDGKPDCTDMSDEADCAAP